MRALGSPARPIFKMPFIRVLPAAFSICLGIVASIGCVDSNGLRLCESRITPDIRQAPEKPTDYRDFACN
jgi:hypothetical protein